MRTFGYQAYGLSIRSGIRLPELLPHRARADAIVRLGRADRRHRTGDPARLAHVTARSTYLWWDGVGAIRVHGGREILADRVAGAEPRVLRSFLLGPAFGALLRQRGALVLHASAVKLEGGAIVFLGGSGWGKSTLAAALHARGHPLLADDVVALRADGARWLVSPSFPQLSLWPDAASVLGSPPDSLPRLHPSGQKRTRRAGVRFSTEPCSLSRLYVLAAGASHAIEALPRCDALVELLRHSYGALTLHRVRTTKHFRQCARLAAEIPVTRLRFPRSLTALPEVACLVEEDSRHEA